MCTDTSPVKTPGPPPCPPAAPKQHQGRHAHAHHHHAHAHHPTLAAGKADPALPKPSAHVPGGGHRHAAGDGRLRLRRGAPHKTVVVARLRDVRHMPAPFDPSQPRQTLPFLCESFYATGLCPGAGACPDVHVDPGRVLAMAAHVRMQQPQPEPERLGAAGHALLVATDADPTTTVRVDAGQCLPTRAFRTPRRRSSGTATDQSAPPPRLCAHFASARGVCDYGVECRFVHWLGDARQRAAPEPSAPARIASTLAVATATLHDRAALPPAAFDCATTELNTRYRHHPYGVSGGDDTRPGWTVCRRSNTSSS